jgi:hypothetical protein
MNMNKSDFAWIGIRLFGVFFFVQALVNVVEVVTAVYSVLGETSVSWGINRDDVSGAILSMGVRMGAFIALYLGLSYYFLIKGKYVHRLLVRDLDEDET